jgi:hypothetical protein
MAPSLFGFLVQNVSYPKSRNSLFSAEALFLVQTGFLVQGLQKRQLHQY